MAVYDKRYNGSKDLQEDVDIGMSRSTDGGRTWEPMRVIVDLDEGGRPTRWCGRRRDRECVPTRQGRSSWSGAPTTVAPGRSRSTSPSS